MVQQISPDEFDQLVARRPDWYCYSRYRPVPTGRELLDRFPAEKSLTIARLQVCVCVCVCVTLNPTP